MTLECEPRLEALLARSLPSASVTGRTVRREGVTLSASYEWSDAPLSVELTKRALNRTYEMMNMRQALLAALDTDTLIEAGAGPERTEFNRIRKEKGLKAAIEWRDARFKQ